MNKQLETIVLLLDSLTDEVKPMITLLKPPKGIGIQLTLGIKLFNTIKESNIIEMLAWNIEYELTDTVGVITIIPKIDNYLDLIYMEGHRQGILLNSTVTRILPYFDKLRGIYLAGYRLKDSSPPATEWRLPVQVKREYLYECGEPNEIQSKMYLKLLYEKLETLRPITDVAGWNEVNANLYKIGGGARLEVSPDRKRLILKNIENIRRGWLGRLERMGWKIVQIDRGDSIEIIPRVSMQYHSIVDLVNSQRQANPYKDYVIHRPAKITTSIGEEWSVTVTLHDFKPPTVEGLELHEVVTEHKYKLTDYKSRTMTDQDLKVIFSLMLDVH